MKSGCLSVGVLDWQYLTKDHVEELSAKQLLSHVCFGIYLVGLSCQQKQHLEEQA